MDVRATSLNEVLGDPQWFAYGFEPPSGTIAFTQASRDQIAAQPFLDTRWNRIGYKQGRAHLSNVVAVLGGKFAPPNLRFIWHSGFCCSTLLAKALDATGRNLSLCEPKLLVDVADAKRAGTFAMHTDFAKFPDIAFKLLARGFSREEVVTLKPAPAANHLLPEAIALPGSRHLFLYSRCESFIISITRLGAEGANYARAMLGVMQRDGIALEWTPERMQNLTPLQLAALLWHMQIAEFRKSAGPDTCALDCDVLLADPKSVLRSVDKFFGFGLGAEHIARATEGSLFRRNAKNPSEQFDADRRRNEYSAARKRLGSELSDAVAWSSEVFRDTPADVSFAVPLMALERAGT